MHPNHAPRKDTKLALGVALLLAAAAPLSATHWYVDNAIASSGSGTGSWANAKKTFAEIPWGSVAPGDTINVSGGSTSKTYTERWTMAASGSSGNPITVRTGQDGGHNGTVIFDWSSHLAWDGVGYKAPTLQGILCAQSHIVFSGDVGGQRRMEFHNYHHYTSRSQGYAIRGTGAVQSQVYEYMRFKNLNGGIQQTGTSQGITVRHCVFEEIRGESAVGLNGSAGGWDSHHLHDNVVETRVNYTNPPGTPANPAYSGPDGFTFQNGASVYNNTFRTVVAPTGEWTSTQHPDHIQMYGDFNKVYGNEFIDFGDAGVSVSVTALASQVGAINDIRIYNNTFRVTANIAPFPQIVRVMGQPDGYHTFVSLTNYKLLNNTFIDNTVYNAVKLRGWSNTPSGSGNEIKNNIFYNCGGTDALGQTMRFENCSSLFPSGSIDYNVFWNDGGQPAGKVHYNGTTYTTALWVSGFEPNGSTSQPIFTTYSYRDPANDLHLAPTDTVARDAGASFASIFTTDIDGTSRPQGPAWDIGAYETLGTPAIHLALDENSGTTAFDSSGNGNDGTLSPAPAWTSGQIGSALSFDGVDDKVDAGSDATLDNLPAITVSAWIKASNMGEGGFGRIVQKGNNANPTGGFRFHVQGTNELLFAVDRATTDLSRATATNVITTGKWKHVVATWDGTLTSGSARIYVDGAEVSGTTTVGSGARGDDAAGNLWIGNESGGTRTFNGTIDDVRVYGRKLEASEVLALFQAAPPLAPTGLNASVISYNQINLSWTDESSTELGFKIERKTGAGGAWAEIGTAAANATTFSDNQLGAGTTYYYRVRAHDADGHSPYSNEASQTTTEITSGRRGHWKLDETSGTSASDSSGNGNTGTLTGGPTWTAGKLANGLSFDGVDDRVNAGSGTTLDNLVAQGSGGMTITAWIKPTSMGEGGKGRIADKSTAVTPANGWALLLDGTNQVKFIVDHATTDLEVVSVTNSIVTGDWRHVTLTWTGSTTATTAKLYVDGIEVSYATQINGSGTRASDASSELSIGNDSTTARTFNGVLDDVRVYNRVLTAGEIQAISRAGL